MGVDGCLGEAGWRQELKAAVVADAVSSLFCSLHTSQDLAEAALFCPPLPSHGRYPVKISCNILFTG